MAGLADEVALRKSDRPQQLGGDTDDVDLALPDVVVAQLLAEESPALLEQMAGRWLEYRDPVSLR